MKEFYRVLLSSNEEGLVKSYMESHELTIEFMREISNSQYCELFFNFVHSRLYNQQVKEANSLADVDDSQVQTEEHSEDEVMSTFDKFLFERIDVEQLFCNQVSEIVKKVLKCVEYILSTNDIVFWGQIYAENEKVTRLISHEQYRIFSANVERCFGRKVYDIPYIKSVLAPMISDFSQKKAEMKRIENEKILAAKRERCLNAPISEIFGKDTEFYQGLSRSEKNRVTRILKKIGEWNIATLKTCTPEDIKSELKSDELMMTFDKCMQAYA